MKNIIEILRQREKQTDRISSWLYTKVQSIMAQAANHLQYVTRVMPEFDLHDSSHSKEVLEVIEKVVGSSAKNLSSFELFYIIASSYLHDCGMALSDYEVHVMELTEGTKDKYINDESLKNDGKKCLTFIEAKEVIKQHKNTIYHSFNGEILNWLFVPSSEEELIRYFANLLIGYQKFRNKNYATIKDSTDFAATNRYLRTEYIRSTHNKRVSEYIKNWGKTMFSDFPVSGIGQQIANDLASICEAHCESPEYIGKLKTQIVYCGSDFCNLQYVAMLLRIGDIVHFNHDRAPLELRALHQFDSNYSFEQWRMKSAVDYTITKNKIAYSAFISVPADYYRLQNYIDWIDNELKLFLQLSIHWDNKYKLSLKEKVDRSNITYDSSIFIPVQGLMFTLEQNRILKLLMGTSLYKDEYAYIRELYQNSLDACRYQIAKDKACGKVSKGIIEFGINEEDGEKYLYCLDNGKGMTKSIIENYLLKIGNSYYKSSEFYNIHAETGSYYTPTSQFGIGILSCFMMGKRIEIVTKEDNGDYIACSIDGPSEYFYYKTPSEADKDMITTSGTIIKVFLKKEYYEKLNATEIPNLNIISFDIKYKYLRLNKELKDECEIYQYSLYNKLLKYIQIIPEEVEIYIKWDNQNRQKIYDSPKIFTSKTLSESDMDILDQFWNLWRYSHGIKLKDYINLVECQIIDIKHQGIQYRSILKLPKPGTEQYGYEVMKYLPIQAKCGICVDGIPVINNGLSIYSLAERLNHYGIVNFYGEDRPQLSVDRTTIVDEEEGRYDNILAEIILKVVNDSINKAHQHIKKYQIAKGSELYHLVWKSVFSDFSYFSSIFVGALSQCRNAEEDIEWDNLSAFIGKNYRIKDFLVTDEIEIKDYDWHKLNDVSQILMLNKLYAASEIVVDENTIRIKSGKQQKDKILEYSTEDNIDRNIFQARVSSYGTTFKEYDIISNLYPMIPDYLYDLIRTDRRDILNTHFMRVPYVSNEISAIYEQSPKEVDEVLGLYLEDKRIWKTESHLRKLCQKRNVFFTSTLKTPDQCANEQGSRLVITAYIAPQKLTENEIEELEMYKQDYPSYYKGVKEGWSIILTGENDEKANLYIKAGKCTRKDLVRLIPSSFWEKFKEHTHVFPDGTKVRDLING